PDLRIAIFKWINKHIKNDTGDVKDTTEYKQFAEVDLRVFPKDEDLPKDSLNGKIDETFVPLRERSLPEARKFAEWKADLMKELRAKSFRTLPERVPAGTIRAEVDGRIFEIETEPALILLASARFGNEQAKKRNAFVLGKQHSREARNASADFLNSLLKKK